MSEFAAPALRRLATAHLALAVWIVVATLVVLVTADPARLDDELHSLAQPAQLSSGFGWAYVAVSVLTHGSLGLALRRRGDGWRWKLFTLALDHLLLLAMTFRIAQASPESPIYLARLGGLLTVLATTSLLGGVLSLASLLLMGRAPVAGRTSRFQAALWPLHFLLTLLTIGALYWLHLTPLVPARL